MPITVHCPVCGHALRAPDDAVGKAAPCPVCKTRVIVPGAQPPPAPAEPPIQIQAKPPSVIPKAEYVDQPVMRIPPAPAPAPIPIPPPAVLPAGKKAFCPACGQGLTITPDLEGEEVTCPFCATTFQALGESRRGSKPGKKPRDADVEQSGSGNQSVVIINKGPSRRPGYSCPFCHTREMPFTSTRITTVGWLVFFLLLFFCFPLCFIGLLMTESRRRCPECRFTLD